LRGCAIKTIAELHTNFGRPDLVIEYSKKVWIVEIKVAYDGESPEQKAKEALNQIFDKKYNTQFPTATCLGIAIDNEKRQITNWETNVN
jgi:hypothetical protein